MPETVLKHWERDRCPKCGCVATELRTKCGTGPSPIDTPSRYSDDVTVKFCRGPAREGNGWFCEYHLNSSGDCCPTTQHLHVLCRCGFHWLEECVW